MIEIPDIDACLMLTSSEVDDCFYDNWNLQNLLGMHNNYTEISENIIYSLTFNHYLVDEKQKYNVATGLYRTVSNLDG